MDFRKLPAVIVALLWLAPAAAVAQKLDKDAKKWLEEVRPIILPDEEKTYREIKDKGDREEFQKIFWARRDANPETPQNEFQEAYLRSKAEADAQFRVAGKRGSETDCGRVFILLGKPDEMKSDPMGETPMLRTPETWTYRDRPGQTFEGGVARISFSGNCELPQGNRFGEALNKLAANKIANPNIGFKQGDDGKLTRLADQLPKPSPAQTLLTTPRQDFVLTAEPSMYLPAGDGSVFVAGLLRADATGFPLSDVKDSGSKVTKVIVATRAVDGAGKVLPGNERQVTAEVAPDNAVVVSFGMALQPGDYTLHVAGLEPQSGKGSTVAVPLKVPDFNVGELVVSPLTILLEVQEGITAKKPEDPLADFVTGAGRLVPRYGNVFTSADSITVIAQVHNAKPEADSTGKDSSSAQPRDADGRLASPPATVYGIAATFTILKDGKAVAKAAEQNTPIVSVGPVPLGKYPAGTYTVQLKVTDKVAKKDYVSEATFQIK